jgi:hypothetical protein
MIIGIVGRRNRCLLLPGRSRVLLARRAYRRLMRWRWILIWAALRGRWLILETTEHQLALWRVALLWWWLWW